jgi:exo-beta-1,3-glucanase (GH17 family)/cellulose synthase/poly-beta-1,6-N-acetylglucosamine synthase-like glycosyltransferase
MRWPSLAVAAIFAALTYAFWAFVNQPTAEPAWPSRIQGFAFSPYQADQDAVRGDMPTAAQIESDLKLLEGKTNAVRTYSSLDTFGQIPTLAAKHHLNVAVGAWVDARRNHNQDEIAAAIKLAHDHMNVVRVIIGNEAILRGDIPLEEMYEYLDRAREAIGQPVSTAEPWHVWLKNPELASHVDYIAVHLLPYWEGTDVERAVDYSVEKMHELQKAFPGKPIVIGEVGWPSNGRTRESAVASESNQALFLRRFLSRAEKEGWIYYVMEAFDQPWKASTEGGVGAYWGVYDVQRRAKFPFIEPIVRMPQWRTLAGVSVVLALVVLALLYVNSGTLRSRGRSFLAVVVYATATAAVWVFYDYSQQYLTVQSVLVGLLLFAGTIGVILVLFAEAHEWAEARWVTARQRLIATRAVDDVAMPRVSIHVPAYNEPPEMVIETLDALARLDYPDYEVIVVDNNTADPAVWRPVQDHCATLGERFRFFHVEKLAGFKAGALNFALNNTSPDAVIVAVIDSDYVVEPGWLRDLVPAFGNPKVAIVQAPQDYRDATESAFKAMAYAEYRGFFHVGMVTRNERNAIIQHGTMTLVRYDVLMNVSRWAEWCITEDAELGLSIFEAGFEAAYTPRSYGRGLMPDTFVDFKKQRFRWAYGAMQILKAHRTYLFRGRDPRIRRDAPALSPGQRYHFVAGWLPWVADGFNLLFNFAALGWSFAMIVAPTKIDAPLMMFSVLPMSLFAFKLIKLMHLYGTQVGANLRQTIAAAIAGLALAHTIGLAVVKGIVTRSEPFFRTPKNAQRQALSQAFASAREETLMLVALLLAAWAVAHVPITDSPDLRTWVIVLAVQAIPYACSLLVSLASALRLPASLIGTDYRAGMSGAHPVVTSVAANAAAAAAAAAVAVVAGPGAEMQGSARGGAGTSILATEALAAGALPDADAPPAAASVDRAEVR